jgi:tRNA U34 5-carboxymethylaminomethyl modifying enzyme MnmG/GidA
MGLTALLAVLIFLLYVPTEKRVKKAKAAKKSSQEASEKPSYDLEDLRDIVKNKKSTNEELKEALELVIKYHGTMHKKLGMRPHPDSDIYMDILFKAARHPNADKNLIITFNKELEKLNPEYKKEINDALMRGLNSRGL